MKLLNLLGAEVRVIAPPTLMPDLSSFEVTSFHDMRKGIKGCDIIMMLRLQTERMEGNFIFGGAGTDIARNDLGDRPRCPTRSSGRSTRSTRRTGAGAISCTTTTWRRGSRPSPSSARCRRTRQSAVT